MPTIAAQLDQAFRQAIQDAFGVDADPLVAVSQSDKFGDYQSNAAMGLVKILTEKTGQKQNPRAIAEQIKEKVAPILGDMVSELTIAGPGFLNVRLSPAWLSKRLQDIAADKRLGIPLAQSPQTVVVDYSGPNIAKEMHVGHLRGTIVGDSFARILSFIGHHVIRQNHIGDWGLQMGMVTFALSQQASSNEELSLGDLERMYKQINKASEDPATRRQMAERTAELQNSPKAELTSWRNVRTLTLDAAHEMYRRLGVLLVESDVRGESDYSDSYGPLVEDLIKRGLAKETAGAFGMFPPGFTNRENEPRPFIIRSRDGSYQYPTFDLAALTFRLQQLHATRLIYTHDSRQSEHFAMLFAVARMLGLDHVGTQEVKFEYAPFGTVTDENGKPLKSRSGDNIKLSELLDETISRALKLVTEKNPELPEDQREAISRSVGVGAIKYFDLSKDRNSDYVFSWDKMLAMDGNTGPYLQYAYARIKSIHRKAQASGLVASKAQSMLLDSPFELALAKHVLRLGETIEVVARDLKPHLLCLYLYELAGKFSSFYENCPVLQSEEPTRSSRLALSDLTARTLQIGLDLLGIEHPEQM